MGKERETRTEPDIWGNSHEYIYEDGKRVGEYKNEERGGFLGIGGERQRVEYDADRKEVGYSRTERRGGILGIGGEDVEANYDSFGQRSGFSRVEERGGFLGIGTHHERIGYDEGDNEVSSTHWERRGGFLGIGERRARVTRYRREDSDDDGYRASSGGDSDLSEGLMKLGFGLLIVCLVIWLVFAVLLPLAIVDAAAIGLSAAAMSEKRRTTCFGVSAAGAAYILLDYNAGWLTRELMETLPFLAGWTSAILYLNVSAGLVSCFFLLSPAVARLDRLRGLEADRRQLVLAASLLAAGVLIFAGQRWADSRWERDHAPMASVPATVDSESGPAVPDSPRDVARHAAAPVTLPPSPAEEPPSTQAAAKPVDTLASLPAAARHDAPVPVRARAPRLKPVRAVVPAAAATLACVLPDGREARLTADQCENAGGMEYR